VTISHLLHLLPTTIIIITIIIHTIVVTFEQLDFKLIIKDSEYENKVIDLELFEGDNVAYDDMFCNDFFYTICIYSWRH